MALFTITVFLGSALLFVLEPMAARRILPVLGGTPAVWTTCMLFYQALLLAGYAYVHALTAGAYRHDARARARSTAVGPGALVLHALVLLLPFAPLAAGMPKWTPPAGENPVPWLLLLLAISVGLPFFAVATTAPLIQKWLSESLHPHGRDPYFLYAASNLGSLVGLLAYPLVFEPTLGLERQALLWTVGYALLVVLTIGCAVVTRRMGRIAGGTVEERLQPAESAGVEWRPTSSQPMHADSPSLATRLRWIALAFVPASLLLGVTTHLSTNITPFTLLWVIPLALYLLTFMLVFARRPLLPHRWMLMLQPLILLPLAVVFFSEDLDVNARIMFPFHLLAFFVTAMVCHGELARTRPPARHLTTFYLCLALGGALGGVFNAVLAPLLFDWPAEYPVVLALACLLRPRTAGARGPLSGRAGDLAWAAGVALILLALLMGVGGRVEVGLARRAAVLGPAAAACLLLVGRPAALALSVASLLAFGAVMPDRERVEVLRRDRSFFGSLKVERYPDGFHMLVHGNILHGAQSTDPAKRREPLTYYHERGPIGQLFAGYDEQLAGARIGVVGLGIGTMACYAEPGQTWTFYEIDPAVERLARDVRYFSYLRDCAPQAAVVLGDGRLMLTRMPDRHFRLLAFDAFSSDAIPIHLVTREALRLYLRKLEPHGLLAFHISSRFVDLRPVLEDLAQDLGLVALIQQEAPLTQAESYERRSESTWVVMARAPRDLLPLLRDRRWRHLATAGKQGVWTDDFSNVLSIVRWP